MSEPVDVTTLLRQTVEGYRASLPMFTIYDHPTDYPNAYVARLWLTLPEPRPTQITLHHPDLAALQQAMTELGLSKLDRMPLDDPKILETWT